MKYYITTMGCQLNENDSEKLAGIVEGMGFEKTEKLEEADLVIYNTCCVRENAEERLFGKLGELKKQKEEKGTIIAIGGCMMQEPAMLEKIKKSYNYTDIVFGTHTLHKFEEDLKKVLENGKKVRDVIDIDGEVIEDLPIKRNDNFKASVTIMYGCNNFCSYCIIPFMRGNIRIKDFQTAIFEAEHLAQNGHQEIVLTGIHTGSYGCGTDHDLTDLINAMSKIEKLQNIRISSIVVTELDDKFMEMLKSNPKVCHHMHIPLQSGSDKILKLMNRKYNKKEFLDKIKKIRECIPDINITTDVITGFPNETEEDFEECLNFVREIGFSKVHTFPYSERTGTAAAKMKNQVPMNIRKERAKKLIELSDELEFNYNKHQIGKIFKTLIEEVNDNESSGHTSTYLKVIVKEKLEHNKFYNIKITEAYKDYVVGIIVNN